MKTLRFLSFFCSALATFLAPLHSSEEVYNAFPETTVAFAKLNSPVEIVKTILNHPLREKLEQLDDVATALKSPEFLQFQAGLRFVEFQLNSKWDDALQKLTGHGVFAGFDAATQGVVAVAVAEDEKFLTKTITKILELAKADKVKQPFEEKKYRGLTAYKFEDAIFAQIDNKLVFSNKVDLAKKIADNLLDGSSSSLRTKAGFQAARTSLKGTPSVWAYVDLEFLRNNGIAKELFREKAENIAAEFVIGGITEAIRGTSHAILQANLDGDRFNFTTSVPFDKNKRTEAREYFFGGKDARLPPILKPDHLILNVVTYRDLSRLWLSKEDLLEEDQIAELVKADSELTTVFSGLDFGEEVLGSAKPGIQFLIAKQDYDQDLPIPDIKLPSFAFAFQLQDAAKVQRRFKIGFQSFVGFINIEQAQNGQPQFDLETETVGKAKVVSANYFDDGIKKQGLINYNFSPTLAFVDDWFFISSTNQFARQLVQEPSRTKDSPQAADLNTRVELTTSALRDVLNDNQEQLVAQNMLENGHSKSDAQKEIATLIDLLGLLANATIDLDTADQLLTLSANFAFKK